MVMHVFIINTPAINHLRTKSQKRGITRIAIGVKIRLCKSKKTELDQRGGVTVVQLSALEMEGSLCDDSTVSL